jgi:hypothetical protein
VPQTPVELDISNNLRCYKAETLCKPLFYKTVLHCELAWVRGPQAAFLQNLPLLPTRRGNAGQRIEWHL